MLHQKQDYIQQEKLQSPCEDNSKLHGYWVGNYWLDITSPARKKSMGQTELLLVEWEAAMERCHQKGNKLQCIRSENIT